MTERRHAAKRTRSRLSYEARIILRAVLCALPPSLVAIFLLHRQEASWETWVTALAIMFLPLPFLAWRLQSWITHPLRVAANVLASIREGDYTLRSKRRFETSGIIVELYQEINAIASIAERNRIGGIETRLAIDKITANIDVATLIVDAQRKVVQANDAARHLIASIAPSDRSPLDRTLDELQLGFCLDASSNDFSRFSYRDKDRRFEGRRGAFRMDDLRYDLIVLTDITRAASEQERDSWKRLLRVLGHELNNSVAPISSLANTLSKMTRSATIDADTKTDLLDGLDAIASRSTNIVRFMQDYTQLAKLPEPRIEHVQLEPLVRKACQLFAEVRHDPCEPDIRVLVDPLQLEQALINLLKNALEAGSANGHPQVICRCSVEQRHSVIRILDEGTGISNSENLFVPFYTTKPRGSGIGLAISKQIVEASGGTISLANRDDAQGCVATVRLPLAP